MIQGEEGRDRCQNEMYKNNKEKKAKQVFCCHIYLMSFKCLLICCYFVKKFINLI